MNAISMPNPYSKKRVYIAAALYAGACVPTVQLRTSSDAPFKLLPGTVIMRDIPLITLLLNHGADIHEKGDFSVPTIYLARTKAIADLLIKKGAIDILPQKEKDELLFRSMRPSYEPSLVDFYLQYTSSGVLDEQLNTPLMHLAIFTKQDMKRKAKMLFANRSPKELRNYINHCNKYNANVFDMITNTFNRTTSQKERRNLQQLHTFLVDQLNQEICDICFDQVDLRLAKTFNGHKMHVICFNWADQIHALDDVN